jgi:hypothetical protein
MIRPSGGIASVRRLDACGELKPGRNPISAVISDAKLSANAVFSLA